MPDNKFYKTKKWEAIRQQVIFRDKDICFFCGKLILKRRTIHHKKELNENTMDLAYDLDNLVECHDYCHNWHHERFGYKKTIVDESLEIDYTKRTI